MTNPKTVKEVLEELQKTTLICLSKNSSVYDYKKAITQAQLHLDALYKAWYLGMLPEEKKLDYSKTDFVSNNTDALYGFNSAIQEMKRRVNER